MPIDTVTEAAKLLREFEKEARERVLSAFAPSRENMVEGTVVVVNDPMRVFEAAVHVHFKLNGKDYQKTEYVSRLDLGRDRAMMADVLRKAISEAVASVLVIDIDRGLKLTG